MNTVRTRLFNTPSPTFFFLMLPRHPKSTLFPYTTLFRSGKQEQMSIPTLVAMVLGIMAARSRPDLAQAVIAGAGASGIQSQLNYTRDFEREADRIGFQFQIGRAHF